MTQIDDLPPLRDVIAKHDLQARKSLGQNFLLDLNLTAKIAKVAGPLEGITVVEVGPGPGGLTRALLAQGAQKVIAIEKDRRAIAALEEIAAHYPGRLDIVTGDALEFDAEEYLDISPPLAGEQAQVRASELKPWGVKKNTPHPNPLPQGERDKKARIIANLPYNIATPLLTGWLTKPAWPPWFDSMTLMFQKEVAERIVAKPGNKTYGRLSVLAQALCEVKIAFDVPPQAFVPAPKVTSSVVYFKPKPEAADIPREALQAVTRAAFGQRRKMLRQSLKALNTNIDGLLEKAIVDNSLRAEQLSVKNFIEISMHYSTYLKNR